MPVKFEQNADWRSSTERRLDNNSSIRDYASRHFLSPKEKRDSILQFGLGLILCFTIIRNREPFKRPNLI